jgi:hypothetical protein
VTRYEIRVKGRVSASVQAIFCTMSAQIEPVGTVLTGTFEDQAALFGALMQIEALGLELVEVRRTASTPEDEAALRRMKTAPAEESSEE